MLTKSKPLPYLSEVCKEAKADLAFLVDGSWSIGDDNFMKITRFLYSTVGSLDLIGQDGTQVSHMTAFLVNLSRFTHSYLFSPKICHYMGKEDLWIKTSCCLDRLALTHSEVRLFAGLGFTFRTVSGCCV